MLAVLCVLLAVNFLLSEGQDRPFCSETHTNSSNHGLQFSQKNKLFEFGKRWHYKELHCCFANYTTIKWYKDNTRLLEVDTYYVTTFNEPRDGNQTLVSNRLSLRDKGNYTCIASNGTHALNHTIALSIDTRNRYDGTPFFLIREPNDSYAWEGENRQFRCEACTGFDEYGESSGVIWLHNTADGRRPVSPDIASITYYERSQEEIKGANLSFNPVTKEAFGTYTCKIYNHHGELFHVVTLHRGDDPNAKYRLTPMGIIVVMAAFFGLCILFSVVLSCWHLELLLLWKDCFGKLEKNDDYEYDIFICYALDDEDFVLGMLLPVLEYQCQYHCFIFMRDTLPGEWQPEVYLERIHQSRRLLLVLSPALADDPWCTHALYVAIAAGLSLHCRIICVLLQDIDWDAVMLAEGQSEEGTLRQVVRLAHVVKWNPHPDHWSKFFHQLRLNLPPRRCMPLRIKLHDKLTSSTGELAYLS